MKRHRFAHADLAQLEAAVLAHDGGRVEFDDYSMYATIPGHAELVADIPSTKTYQSVDVEFDKEPDEDLLRSLGFPFRSGTDINA